MQTDTEVARPMAGPLAEVDPNDPRQSILEAAHSMLDFHVAGTDGFCAGCRQQWHRLVPAPCEQSRWAILVVETHGVAQWTSFGRAGR